jgi:hypothetical protein
VLFSNKVKHKNSTKVQKSKYCNKCKVITHATNSYWYLHPEKKPDWFKTHHKYDCLRQSPDAAKTAAENRIKKEQDKALLLLDLMNLDDVDNKVYYNNPMPTINNILANLILDSGSTQHLICNRSLFLEGSLVSKITKLGWGNNSSINAVAISSVSFLHNTTLIILNNCLFVLSFSVNILLIRKLIEKEFRVYFAKDKATLVKDRLVLEAKFVANMYVLNITNKVVINNYSKVDPQSYILYNVFYHRAAHHHRAAIPPH